MSHHPASNLTSNLTKNEDENKASVSVNAWVRQRELSLCLHRGIFFKVFLCMYVCTYLCYWFPVYTCLNVHEMLGYACMYDVQICKQRERENSLCYTLKPM